PRRQPVACLADPVGPGGRRRRGPPGGLCWDRPACPRGMAATLRSERLAATEKAKLALRKLCDQAQNHALWSATPHPVAGAHARLDRCSSRRAEVGGGEDNARQAITILPTSPGSLRPPAAGT